MKRNHFRLLLRTFTRRFLEHELLAPGGDITEGITNVVAILSFIGLFLSYMLIQKHSLALGTIPLAERAAAAWSDQQLLVSLTILIAGVFVVLCWDTLFPDATDCLVLASLPVRRRTIFAAKVTAVLRVFGFLVLAANAFPLIVFPVLMSWGSDFWRWFIAQAVATAAASLFVFAAAAAIQGVLINLLPYRWFRRLSAVLQVTVLFGLILMLIATPPVYHPNALQRPDYQAAMRVYPGFWFLGLYQAMLGTPVPEAWWLARVALAALAAAIGIAALAYGLGYARFMRKIAEGSGLVTARRRRAWLWPLAGRVLLRDLRQRAVFTFIWRTMTRSRTHRLILAGYGAVAFGYVLLPALWVLHWRGGGALLEPNTHVAGAPLVFSFFALLAMRIVFSIPVDLKANWVFRMTEHESPAAEFAAVRKMLVLAGVVAPLAAPLALAAAIWSPDLAGRHIVLTVLMALIMLEVVSLGQEKIPFTCSYLPAKKMLRVTFIVYALGFAVAAYWITRLELWAALSAFRFYCAAALLGTVLYVLMRWRGMSDPLWGGFIYEEKPDWQVIRLELT